VTERPKSSRDTASERVLLGHPLTRRARFRWCPEPQNGLSSLCKFALAVRLLGRILVEYLLGPMTDLTVESGR
jgi:hypothetical protein